MPRVVISKTHKLFHVPEGANLMSALLKAGMPVASSCHGDGVCAKCLIMIVSGQDQLSSPNACELNLRSQNQIGEGHRVSCQTEVNGDIEVDTSYW